MDERDLPRKQFVYDGPGHVIGSEGSNNLREIIEKLADAESELIQTEKFPVKIINTLKFVQHLLETRKGLYDSLEGIASFTGCDVVNRLICKLLLERELSQDDLVRRVHEIWPEDFMDFEPTDEEIIGQIPAFRLLGLMHPEVPGEPLRLTEKAILAEQFNDIWFGDRERCVVRWNKEHSEELKDGVLNDPELILILGRVEGLRRHFIELYGGGTQPLEPKNNFSAS